MIQQETTEKRPVKKAVKHAEVVTWVGRKKKIKEICLKNVQVMADEMNWTVELVEE